MNDANGHALAIGDLVHPDNELTRTYRIDAFDGTLASCRTPDSVSGPPLKYLPVHLIYVSTPAGL
jgi:hypothetical protein